MSKAQFYMKLWHFEILEHNFFSGGTFVRRMVIFQENDNYFLVWGSLGFSSFKMLKKHKM